MPQIGKCSGKVESEERERRPVSTTWGNCQRARSRLPPSHYRLIVIIRDGLRRRRPRGKTAAGPGWWINASQHNPGVSDCEAQSSLAFFGSLRFLGQRFRCSALSLLTAALAVFGSHIANGSLLDCGSLTADGSLGNGRSSSSARRADPRAAPSRASASRAGCRDSDARDHPWAGAIGPSSTRIP